MSEVRAPANPPARPRRASPPHPSDRRPPALPPSRVRRFAQLQPFVFVSPSFSVHRSFFFFF